MKRLICVVGILGALVFILASVIGGAQIDGYSVISQYISESYATGLPNSEYLRYMYIASGFLLALFGFSAPYLLPKAKGLKLGFILFAFFYGLGTVTTGFFPCDIGCNSSPEKASLSQIIHNAVGFLVYVIVPFCLIGIGLVIKKIAGFKILSKISMISGIITLFFVLLLFGNPIGSFIGLYQRIIEGSILAWVVFTSYSICKN